MKNDTNQNPASLYEDGKQIHTHSKDPGYTMDPASQGIHGKGRQQENHRRAANRYGDNLFMKDPVCLAGAGLVAAGAAMLAYRWIGWDANSGKRESTNGANKDIF